MSNPEVSEVQLAGSGFYDGSGAAGKRVIPGARYLALLAAVLALSACGGGGSSSSSTPSIAGPWSGFYTVGTNPEPANATMGALSVDGGGYFADNIGNVYVLYDLSGSSPFSASLDAIAPPGQVSSAGQKSAGFSVSGTYLPLSAGAGINMRGNFTEDDGAGSASGSFNLSSGNPYDGTSTLAGLQGQWSGYYIGAAGTSINLNFGSGGTFAGNDGYGCLVNGSLVADAPNVNLYDVTFESSGVSCFGSLDGLAYESSSDVTGAFGGAAGTYLYMAVYDQTAAYVIELKL